MDEKINSQKKNTNNKYIQKSNNNYDYEPKKKYIPQNQILSSKNNISTNDTYMQLNKYTKPFKNFSNINKQKI